MFQETISPSKCCSIEYKGYRQHFKFSVAHNTVTNPPPSPRFLHDNKQQHIIVRLWSCRPPQGLAQGASRPPARSTWAWINGTHTQPVAISRRSETLPPFPSWLCRFRVVASMVAETNDLIDETYCNHARLDSRHRTISCLASFPTPALNGASTSRTIQLFTTRSECFDTQSPGVCTPSHSPHAGGRRPFSTRIRRRCCGRAPL